MPTTHNSKRRPLSTLSPNVANNNSKKRVCNQSTPIGQRTINKQTPLHHSKTPLHHSKTPLHHPKTPLHKNSPLYRTPNHRSSPFALLKLNPTPTTRGMDVEDVGKNYMEWMKFAADNVRNEPEATSLRRGDFQQG